MTVLSMNDEYNRAKRNIKDSVFTNLFNRKKYLKELVKVLYPEREWTENLENDDLEILTIKNIFTDGLYNDLGIGVKERYLIFGEAQSVWNDNIAIRIHVYLGETVKRWHKANGIETSDISRKNTPRIAAFVVYTGTDKNVKDELSLNDFYKDDEKDMIDVKVKVYHKEDGTILGQYISFARMYDRKRKEYDDGMKAIRETIEECKEKNILKEYLTENEGEVIDTMEWLFSQELALKGYVNGIKREKDEIIAEKDRALEKNREDLERKDRALERNREDLEKKDMVLERKEAKIIEFEKGKIIAIKKLLARGQMTKEEIADIVGVSIEEVNRVERETFDFI